MDAVSNPKILELSRACRNCVVKINQIFERVGPPMRMPSVLTDLTGTKAGVASITHHSVNFNKILFFENTPDFLLNVVPHELAHLATVHFFGKHTRPHGPEWKQVMRKLGCVPSVTHQYDVSNSSNRLRFQIYCGCAVSGKVSAVIRNKLLKGHKYACKKCNQAISLAPIPAIRAIPDYETKPAIPASFTCAVCHRKVPDAVAKYCLANKARFHGKVFCVTHQIR